MNGRILWIHGMGEKPPPERELARTWRALSEALWLDIPAEAYSIAYWADLRIPTNAGPPSNACCAACCSARVTRRPRPRHQPKRRQCQRQSQRHSQR